MLHCELLYQYTLLYFTCWGTNRPMGETEDGVRVVRRSWRRRRCAELDDRVRVIYNLLSRRACTGMSAAWLSARGGPLTVVRPGPHRVETGSPGQQSGVVCNKHHFFGKYMPTSVLSNARMLPCAASVQCRYCCECRTYNWFLCILKIVINTVYNCTCHLGR